MQPRSETDVVVIGLGPTGAVLTALLAQRGIRVTTFERFPEVFPSPRAVHLDGDTMRVLQEIQVADRFLDSATPVLGMDMLGMAGELIFQFRSKGVTDESGWAEGYMFEQPILERILRGRIAELENSVVHLGHEVTGIEADPDGVGLRVRSDSSAGTTETWTKVVVGCCGARSITRASLGSGTFDYGVDQRWLVVDVISSNSTDLPEVTVQYCEPGRPSTYVPLPGSRRRFELMVLPDEDPDQMVQPESVRQLVARWLAPDEFVVDRATVYTFHGIVADQWYRDGLVIAGDAAHQMPPFLGQGMCAGLRDATNLAWKIQLVLKGVALPSLLETYQGEREPRVRKIIETDLYLGDLIQTRDPEKAAFRDREATKGGGPTELRPRAYPIGAVLASEGAGVGFPLPQPAVQGHIGQDDLLGPGFALIGPLELTPGASQILDRVGTRRIPEPSEFLRAWLQELGVQCALIRPDRIVLGAFNSPEDLEIALGPLATHLTPTKDRHS